MSVDDRGSMLMSLILTLVFLGVLTVGVGMCAQKIVMPYTDQYPLLQGIYLIIYFLSGTMIITGILMVFWYDTITHWDGFE